VSRWRVDPATFRLAFRCVQRGRSVSCSGDRLGTPDTVLAHRTKRAFGHAAGNEISLYMQNFFNVFLTFWNIICTYRVSMNWDQFWVSVLSRRKELGWGLSRGTGHSIRPMVQLVKEKITSSAVEMYRTKIVWRLSCVKQFRTINGTRKFRHGGTSCLCRYVLGIHIWLWLVLAYFFIT
jgi:hypothetical protein